MPEINSKISKIYKTDFPPLWAHIFTWQPRISLTTAEYCFYFPRFFVLPLFKYNKFLNRIVNSFCIVVRCKCYKFLNFYSYVFVERNIYNVHWCAYIHTYMYTYVCYTFKQRQECFYILLHLFYRPSTVANCLFMTDLQHACDFVFLCWIFASCKMSVKRKITTKKSKRNSPEGNHWFHFVNAIAFDLFLTNVILFRRAKGLIKFLLSGKFVTDNKNNQ